MIQNTQIPLAYISPDIASGTISETSCAKKPSTVVFGSPIKLKRDGFNFFSCVIPSVIATTITSRLRLLTMLRSTIRLIPQQGRQALSSLRRMALAQGQPVGEPHGILSVEPHPL